MITSKGYALIIVVVVTLIVSFFIGLMTAQIIYNRYSIKNQIQRIQSLYTAESGIKKALFYLKEDPKKGIEWRTGNPLSDRPIKEKLFYNKNEETEISVLDDCGYLKIRAKAMGRYPKFIEAMVAGIIPDELKTNLCMVSDKPLILGNRGQLNGRIKINQEPVFRGGGIEGIIETDATLSLPVVSANLFTNSINYFRYLLSRPGEFETELFSAQVFSPQRKFMAKKFFVNDAILIENKNFDSLWNAGENFTIASTAEIQISGLTKIKNSTIIAIGPIKILDKTNIKFSKVYSETSIELGDETDFSGVLIAPEIKILNRAKTTQPSVLFSGPPFKKGRIIFNSRARAYCNAINLCSGSNSFIEIKEYAEIEGLIYSIAPIIHNGKINGFVYSSGFYGLPLTEDTTNTNVLNGIIQPLSDSDYFIIPVLFNNIRDFKVIQWQEY